MPESNLMEKGPEAVMDIQTNQSGKTLSPSKKRDFRQGQRSGSLKPEKESGYH